jgi:hypothetical protein
MSTANGRVPNRRTTVRSVRIGALEVRDVTAVVDVRPICEKGMGEVLVGMSVLRKLQVEVNGETLTLRSRVARKEPVEDKPGERISLVLLWQLIGALSVVSASLLAWWRWRWAP